ncbi:hypothetical protein AGRA3207_006921 [Actinomadura graeca]|uniref:Serine/arginine repetitive matrix protein 2 n=1 Tax=Actinomadura graeca TaxID=2750812 RepID=A0ABX8R311_9ACTN|nr:hypothetical protein [Actinomadura graeca]QXJ25430.1 hypothetical protein AGRA3207_006921 [Actinomadura graeca]
MGPPPAGPPWSPPPPVKPSAGWYALPVLFTLVAVVGLAVVLALFLDDSNVAEGPSASGDPRAGLRVELTEGHTYFVYVRDGSPVPYSCSLRQGTETGTVALTRRNSWSASDHAGYDYAATFEAPLNGTALLTCRGTGARMLVTPDDTADFYLGVAVLGAVLLGVLAILAFIFLPVRRGNAKRRAAAARAYPY